MTGPAAYETIELTVDERIATITLDREDRLNAFNQTMLEELIDAFDRIDADDEARCVIVTGRGRAFCAGADLGDGKDSFARSGGPFRMPQDADGGGILARRIFDSAKPLIAAINGPAVGIGATMTLPMDVRLAADGARIGFVFTRRGLVPETAASFFLPRLVGISRACERCLTGPDLRRRGGARGGARPQLASARPGGRQRFPREARAGVPHARLRRPARVL